MNHPDSTSRIHNICGICLSRSGEEWDAFSYPSSLHFEGGIEAAKRCREGSRGDEGGGEAADHDGEHGGKPPVGGVLVAGVLWKH